MNHANDLEVAFPNLIEQKVLFYTLNPAIVENDWPDPREVREGVERFLKSGDVFLLLAFTPNFEGVLKDLTNVVLCLRGEGNPKV